MTEKTVSMERLRTLAKKHVLDIEEETESVVRLSCRTSAGNEEPTKGDWNTIKSFAREMADEFPRIKESVFFPQRPATNGQTCL